MRNQKAKAQLKNELKDTTEKQKNPKYKEPSCSFQDVSSSLFKQ